MLKQAEKRRKGEMILETERLLLRPWSVEDADSLFEYAKDPRVGPIAGWPIHTSVKNSREIIETVLSAEGTFAVCRKEDGRAIGSIGLMIGEGSNIGLKDDEAEIGYWIGVPFWGQGMIPEAVRELMRYAFEELHMKKLWGGYFDGNDKSKRVQEKCGLQYQYTNKDKEWPLMHDVRTEHVTCITREAWRAL
jgi:ribosomal-protein-alanine N-acetyltransferase